MSNYKLPKKENWIGRSSDQQLYLNEKIILSSIKTPFHSNQNKAIALLGYSSDEGVRRNHGRVGSSLGADAIRKQLGKMPNHLDNNTQLLDSFPIILGGSHDLAYGHYNGLSQYLPEGKKIGIINFDTHFDFRPNTNGNTSGTPFYQIAKEHEAKNESIKYMALGIRKDANTKDLFEFAETHQANYLQQKYFCMTYLEHVELRLMQFIEDVDYIYTTIDLDGFSSAYAPGVSASSPMGFSPDIVLKSLKLILESGKLLGLDVVELNPNYDVDDQTAKLAASLVHYVIHKV